MSDLDKPENRKKVILIVIQDWAWVLGSAIAIVFQLWQLSTIGYVVIGLIALVIGTFAMLQMRGLRRVSFG